MVKWERILGLALAIFFVLALLTTDAVAVSTEECKVCHSDKYQKWSTSVHSQKIECEACHQLLSGSYTEHMKEPSEYSPEVNLSARSCANCHSEIFDEWDEYSDGHFDTESMASHSEPVIGLEPRLLDAGRSCVSCKSTDGAILNLMESDVYELAEEEVPEPQNVEEWTIACVACHEPHTTDLRVEDSTQLCSNCHNSEGATADGFTTVARHTQWEMYSSSSYATGNHPGNVGCVDCHMVIVPENKSTQTMGTFGHSFDPDVNLLANSEPTNGCYECHGEALPALVEAKQGVISTRLETLDELQTKAENALESINGTSEYEAQLKNYNNAIFYISSVQNDGSLGIHNGERARNELDMAEELFNAMITSEEMEDKKAPGPGILATISVILMLAHTFKKKE